MRTTNFDRCVTVREAAELACCHHQTLRKAIKTREIEVVRRGGSQKGRLFIRLSALDKWLKRSTIPVSRRVTAGDEAR